MKPLPFIQPTLSTTSGTGSSFNQRRFIGSNQSLQSAQQRWFPSAHHRAVNGDTILPYQHVGANYLVENRNCLLADDMGIGKTVQALVSIAPWERVIVTCQKIAIHNWRRECLKWRPDLIPNVTSGFKRPEQGEVVIISHFGLPEEESRRYLTSMQMTDVRLIIDEVQAVAHGTANITKRHRLLASQCYGVQGLTGTPMPGTPFDLWGVLLTLKIAHKAFPGYEETVILNGEETTRKVNPFLQFQRLCNGERKMRWARCDSCFGKRTRECKKCNGKGRIQKATDQYKWGSIAKEVGERLRTVMLRRTKAEVLPDLPAKRYTELMVDAPDDLIPMLDRVKDKWTEIDQNELPPFDLLAEARAAVAKSRIPDMLDYAKTHGTFEQPMIVFCSHTGPIEALEELAHWRTITGTTSEADREEAVSLFQAGKLRGIGITTDTGGTSLNLTAAHSVLFVDLDWTPTNIWQAEDRAMRKGQKNSVLYVRMVSNHPVDIRVNEILIEKTRMIGEVLG